MIPIEQLSLERMNKWMNDTLVSASKSPLKSLHVKEGFLVEGVEWITCLSGCGWIFPIQEHWIQALFPVLSQRPPAAFQQLCSALARLHPSCTQIILQLHKRASKHQGEMFPSVPVRCIYQLPNLQKEAWNEFFKQHENIILCWACF